MLITQNKSTLIANDGKRQQWIKISKQKFSPKGRGEGIIVSALLTPGDILRIPDHISDQELLNNSL